MHAFSHAEITGIQATRTAEAAAWRLAREAGHHALPGRTAFRVRLGEALVTTGLRLMRPPHAHRLA